MPLQTITTQIDIPEGWEFVRVGAISEGEFFINIENTPEMASSPYDGGCVVIRRVKKYRTPTLPDDMWKQCEFSNKADFSDSTLGKLRGMIAFGPNDKKVWACDGSDYCTEFCRIEIKDNEPC